MKSASGSTYSSAVAPSEAQALSLLPEQKQKVLAVDDDEAALELVEESLRPLQKSVQLLTARTAAEAEAQARRFRPGLVLLDLVLPDSKGLELMERLQRLEPEIEVVLLTGFYSTESAVDSIRRGAYEYLTKPASPRKILGVVRQWLHELAQEEHRILIEAELATSCQMGSIVGRSPLVRELFSRMQRVAPHFTNALVTGEAGTGKELVAQALHQLSRWATGPFVVCNCSTLGEQLIEAELFGHANGTDVGAGGTRKGLIEEANSGVLFLKAVDSIPMNVQAKLLDVLQHRELKRGSDGSGRYLDLGVVAATSHDLMRAVEAGEFCSDLYYRLSEVVLPCPRLAERQDDLGLLAQHFLRQKGAKVGKTNLRLSSRAMAVLQRYDWPGNIRELENVISSAAIIARGNRIEVEHLPERLLRYAEDEASRSRPSRFRTLDDVMIQHVVDVLDHCQGNKCKAIQILGIGRTTLYRILERASRRSDVLVPAKYHLAEWQTRNDHEEQQSN